MVRGPREWLDDWIERHPWSARDQAAGAELIRAVLAEPPRFQVAVHKEAVALLPLLRADRDAPLRWEKGSAVYALACHLYTEALPRSEGDVCALLESSKHDCGHGGDVKAPLEIAVAWARVHGVTAAWLAAVRTFIDGLTGLRSVQANELKKKGGLLLLLDEARPRKGQCWSDRFSLADHAPVERDAWERLVLFMGTAMGVKPPKDFARQAPLLVAFLGEERVLSRLDGWIPDPTARDEWKLETAGSHLLKNLVWLLGAISADRASAASADRIVLRLTRAAFVPEERAKKVVLVCAWYLSRRPPGVGLEPLRRLREWARGLEKTAYDSDGIGKIVAAYEADHRKRR